MKNEHDCIYLKQGEIYFADEPVMINTVLGSCVTVTMYSKEQKCGIICHSMLPCSSKSIHKDDDCMRYVDCAVMYMSDYFTEKGIPRDKTEVKLFGGSDMFSYQGEAPTVGLKNIEAAVNILSKLNYKILSKDVGGQFTRKLYFSTESGTVYVRKISRLQGM